MKVKYPLLLLSVCLLLVTALLAGCSGGNTAATTTPAPATTSAAPASQAPTTVSTAGKVLKIGMILPATGAAAEKGKPGGDAVKDAMEYVNKELNGAEGYQVQISWRDSGYDAAKVTTIVNEFINEGDLLFTTMSSKEMTAAQEIANRQGFPGLVTFAAPNNYNPPAHIYCHMPDYGDDWVSFVNYYLKEVWKGPGKPKMALHLLNNTTGSGVKDAADAKAAALGVDIVAVEEHTATTMSETESLMRIKAKNPDVIFISSTPQPTSIILKNARELGLTSENMVFGLAHASLSSALIKLAGSEAVEGVYGVYPTVTWDDSSLPGIAKAKEYLQKNNPTDAGNMDYLACWSTSLVAAEILRNAVKDVGYDALVKGDAASWKAIEQSGIKKLSGYKVDGIQGPVTYNQGSNKLGNSVKIYRISGGTIKALTDWIEAK
jgi:branched-chain amino acid transport system substrate-binding protein